MGFRKGPNPADVDGEGDDGGEPLPICNGDPEAETVSSLLEELLAELQAFEAEAAADEEGEDKVWCVAVWLPPGVRNSRIELNPAIVWQFGSRCIFFRTLVFLQHVVFGL